MKTMSSKKINEKTSLIIKYFTLCFAVICSLSSLCNSSGPEEPPSPPSGYWTITNMLGTIEGYYRIYADKKYRETYSATQGIPYNNISLQLREMPQDSFVQWILHDPDDPATDNNIDPNGIAGNDNILSGILDNARHTGQCVNNYTYRTKVDRSLQTSVRIKVVPNSLKPDSFYPGDNYFVMAYFVDTSNNSRSMTSCTMSVWKQVRAEVDYSNNGIFNNNINSNDVMDKTERFLTGPVIGHWGNECTYLELNSNTCNSFDQLDYNLSHDPARFAFDTTEPSLANALCNLSEYYFNFDILYPVHIMFYGGIKHWKSSWDRPAPGYGRLQPGEIGRKRSFSIVFIDSVDAIARRFDLTDRDSVVEYTAEITAHELGHQFAWLQHCSQNCVMKSPLNPRERYPFCPYHVDTLRGSRVIHFK